MYEGVVFDGARIFCVCDSSIGLDVGIPAYKKAPFILK